MKKLNENSLEDLLGLKSSNKSTLDILNKPLTKKKKSIFVDVEDVLTDVLEDIITDVAKIPKIKNKPVQTVQNTQIILPKTIAEQIQQEEYQHIQNFENIQVLKIQSQQRSQQKDKSFELLSSETLPQKIQEIKQELEVIREETLPDNVNFIELEEDLESALKEIPDGNDFDIGNIEIIPSKIKKDKTGYYKVKTNIKKDNIPDIINKIASYVKKMTKGIVSPRVCDLRVIGNTNKTQLKNAKHKLSAATIVFKPNSEKLKVNKGTRFMISVPEDYKTTGNLLVYLQESRAKVILEIVASEFKSINFFIEFIGDRIAEYYFHGYEITLKKLQLKGTNNPLMEVINKVLNTGEYKAKPYVDGDNHLFSADFISKGTNNQWLRVNIIEGDLPSTYDVIAKNDADQTWEYNLLQHTVTISWLVDNMDKLLKKAYDRDWTNELDIQDDDDSFYYMYNKITHYKLKKAIINIYDKAKIEPEVNIIIKKALSKKDLTEMLKEDYDSEAIIGTTYFLEYFILTFYAHQIIAGDKRAGKDYITTQDYYQKYNVKDRREYEERDKTILKKQGLERNYNSRIYIFQLEYVIKNEKNQKNKVNIYRTTNYNELCDLTGFLTHDVKFPVSKI